MERKLTTNVNVDGTWYGPDSTVPDHVAERITNPKVWDGEVPAEVEKSSDPAPSKQPPRKGPGSGGPAWIQFAAYKGVEEKFDSKEALIAELESRGLIDKE